MNGVIDGDAHLLVLGLRIGKHLGHVEHPSARHAGAVDHIDPMRYRHQARARIDLAIDGAAVFKAQRVVGKLGSVFEVLQIKAASNLK